MNYLAHIFLSHNDPSIVFGNFMTDMMTIHEIRKWPENLQKGVALHRYIDDFTDHNLTNRNRVLSLHPYFGKYASVVLDIYYDYILFHLWDEYTEIDFDSFCNQQYEHILSYKDMVPARLTRRVDNMTRYNFLHSYTSIEGIRNTFDRLDQRAKYPTGFDKATDVLLHMKMDLIRDFNIFFPAMIRKTKGFLDRY